MGQERTLRSQYLHKKITFETRLTNGLADPSSKIKFNRYAGPYYACYDPVLKPRGIYIYGDRIDHERHEPCHFSSPRCRGAARGRHKGDGLIGAGRGVRRYRHKPALYVEDGARGDWR